MPSVLVLTKIFFQLSNLPYILINHSNNIYIFLVSNYTRGNNSTNNYSKNGVISVKNSLETQEKRIHSLYLLYSLKSISMDTNSIFLSIQYYTVWNRFLWIRKIRSKQFFVFCTFYSLSNSNFHHQTITLYK